MLNRTEYLLNLVQEECSEVAKRASKCIRFGVDEMGPSRIKNNIVLLAEEYLDLIAVLEMLDFELGRQLSKVFSDEGFDDYIKNKIAKVEKYMVYSQERGLLEKTSDIDKNNQLLQETEEEMPF